MWPRRTEMPRWLTGRFDANGAMHRQVTEQLLLRGLKPWIKTGFYIGDKAPTP
jgi:hypothetical protein